MQSTITVEDSRTARAVTHRLLRGLGIGGLAVIASLGLAGRVNATYLHSGRAYAVRFNAGDYIDRGWYYLLDDGQYHYLDRGQYNLLGELGYLLGHPCYPKLFERDFDQAVGFTNRVNTAWLSVGSGQVYPYPLSRQKLSVFKVDSSPCVKAVGTEGARRATGVPTATPYTSAGVQ